MQKSILIDEFHLTVSARRGLDEAEYRAIARTVRGMAFRMALKTALAAVFKKFPSTRNARFRVSS
jgi:hypothetical protein